MTTWLPRGLLFALGMVLVRLAQGALINASPTNSGPISFALCAALGVAAFVVGLLDGLADARANEDPDRRRDLAMRWLLAGLVAGVLSGLVTWIISLFYHRVYVDGLGPELIVFPAFTCLLVFIPAMLGISIGRWMVDRKRPAKPRMRMPGSPRDDVFAAALADDPAARFASTERREENWRQEYREANRERHEEIERHIHDRDNAAEEETDRL